jgi:5-methylcytosine-specific restriction enzyme subunit McrC
MGKGAEPGASMSNAAGATLEVEEFADLVLPRTALHPEVAGELVRRFSREVEVQPPNVFRDAWVLTPRSWVGYVPLAHGCSLYIRPKVPLANLFRMLEYAYEVEFRVLEGVSECDSLEEFFERLAGVLAKRVLARARKGFYRAYVGEEEKLPYVRGRLDTGRLLRAPWDVQLNCRYEEHTGDIEDNRILAWTLHAIARSGLCSERTLPTVRAAYRSLQGLARLQPATPRQCLGRLYHRLNDDYQPLHGLCRFFLEHAGPTHARGDRETLPFLINMALLFERFVAAWLRQHLPPSHSLKVQERVEVSEGQLRFDIDLVLYEVVSGLPCCVLDTKYKAAQTPSNADVNQVVTYAQLKGTPEAVLLYPTPSVQRLDVRIGSTRVRALPFDIGEDLDKAGEELLSKLVPSRR